MVVMSKAIIFKSSSNEKVYPVPFYPIGSIYISVNDTNPSAYFGGSWEQIQDRFLLACGNSFKNGSIGGEVNVTLNTNQIPSHNHTGNTAGSGNHTHQVALNGDGSFDIWYRLNWGGNHTGYCISGNNINGQSSGASFPSIAKDSGWHGHSFTTDNTGSNQSHNNMPPYLAVFVWKRVK